MSVHALARYREDAVSGRNAARITKHLATCRACAEVSARLAGVTMLLALAEMPPMPSQLADRIEMALAAENTAMTSRHEQAQGADGSAGEVTVHTPGRPDLPERSSRKSWRPRVPDLTSPRLMRGLAATAAVLLLGGVGYAVANRNTPPAQAPAPRVAAPAQGRRLRSVPFKSTTSLSGGVKQLSFTLHGKHVSYMAMTTHEDFTPGNLTGKIRLHMENLNLRTMPTELPATAPSPTPAQPAKGSGSDARIGGITVSQLGGCLSDVTSGRPVAVVLVARYEGQPAMIIVLSSRSGGSGLLNVIVVGLACSASYADIITQATIRLH